MSFLSTVSLENLASIILGESVKGKVFGDLNFGDDLPVGLASRLGSCTQVQTCTRSCTKTFVIFKLATLFQIFLLYSN